MKSSRLFQEALDSLLSTYFPGWAKKQGISPSSRTLRRWLQGEKPTSALLKSLFDTIRENIDKSSAVELQGLEKSFRELMKLYETIPELEGDKKDYIGAEAWEIEFDRWCAQATNQIWVIQDWMSYSPKFVDNLVYAAVQRNIPTKVLLLSPQSPIHSQRLRDRNRERYEYWGYLDDLRKSIQETNLATCASFDMRFYETYPRFAAYVADDKILLAQFWYGKKTSDGPHLFISGKSEYGKLIMRTIKAIWENNSRPAEESDWKIDALQN